MSFNCPACVCVNYVLLMASHSIFNESEIYVLTAPRGDSTKQTQHQTMLIHRKRDNILLISQELIESRMFAFSRVEWKSLKMLTSSIHNRYNRQQSNERIEQTEQQKTSRFLMLSYSIFVQHSLTTASWRSICVNSTTLTHTQNADLHFYSRARFLFAEKIFICTIMYSICTFRTTPASFTLVAIHETLCQPVQ